MAISLLSANNAFISAGDVAAIAAETALTVAVTVRVTALQTDRIISQWHSAANAQAFLCVFGDTDEVAFVVTDGTNYFGRKTTAANLVAGQVYRLVFTWSAPATMAIYVNGVSQTIVEHIGSDNVAAIQDSNQAVLVGYETVEDADPLDGDYGEIAIWGSVISSNDIALYSVGVVPPNLSESAANRILYIQGLTTTSLTDPWGGATVTQTNGTNAAHFSIYVPGQDDIAPLVRRRRRHHRYRG